MHATALSDMEVLLSRAPRAAKTVLDVGARDVNGTYRPLCLAYGWHYTGLDICDGPNVDAVPPPDAFPFDDNTFDVVISGSTMEHVEKPWLWIPELARVLKPGGLLAVLTHWSFPLHCYPVDTYRFMPDGMKVLFDEAGCLVEYEIAMVNEQDIVGSALKLSQQYLKR